jgi:three-Cys-motif partner protein
MTDGGFVEIESHTLHKYNILKKYLDVCTKFHKIYDNFVYVDTHGGSGTVSFKSKDQWVEGSPLIASRWNPSAPCHIVEIDADTYRCLCNSTSGCANVHTYHGDCNEWITSILSMIPKWQKFVFFFVDPSSLVYHGPHGTTHDQVRAETIRIIARFPRSELLLNFPLESILRCAGDTFNNPTDPRAIASGERVTTFMGSNAWINFTENQRSRRMFLETYMKAMLGDYPYKGAMLIRSEIKNLPLYYLVYSTHNKTAAGIMRDIMRKEGGFPLYRDMISGQPQTLDEVYPLNNFVFEYQ